MASDPSSIVHRLSRAASRSATMLPLALPPEMLILPAGGHRSIALITGDQLRHRRFALRIQQAFGDQVIAWFELSQQAPRRETQAETASGIRVAPLLSAPPTWGQRLRQGDISTRLRRRWHARRDQRRLHAYFAAQQRAEQALFAAEVAELADFAAVQPQRIHPADVNGAPFIAQMQALSPFFLLTLGGPLYKPALLATVRGVALNQHAGHSPDLRGSNTTEWALYHRDLDRVSATIHLTTSGADAGPILRRSQPCLFPDDDPNTIFARVVALGTELLIESVRQIMAGEPVRVFPQPPHSGRTHLGQELNAILAPIQRDFAADWLPAELQRQRQF